jgi:hypothetical protein
MTRDSTKHDAKNERARELRIPAIYAAVLCQHAQIFMTLSLEMEVNSAGTLPLLKTLGTY